MRITWKDLKIDFNHIDQKRLTESCWLIGIDKKPILMSSICDFLKLTRNNEINKNIKQFNIS